MQIGTQKQDLQFGFPSFFFVGGPTVPVKEAAKTIKNRLWGMLNAIILKVSNGPAESINSRSKTIKARARGFRNKDRFVDAIHFHLGGLDLSPRIRKINFSQK
ncbi:MAG: transposase [Bacteroidota bacterium]|nr:transposase [Bacteroidota bacterium]